MLKIILRKDVEKLGEAGSLASVKNGYARNYLIPQGLAVAATPGELKMWEHNQGVKAKKIERQERELQSLADKIGAVTLNFEARSGEGGRLFGSVTAADIAEKLSAKVGEEIDRRKVVLADPIRTTGEHTVTVNVIGKLRPTVKIVVSGIQDEVEEAEPDAVESEEVEEAS